jgi:hypothetical protein
MSSSRVSCLYTNSFGLMMEKKAYENIQDITKFVKSLHKRMLATCTLCICILIFKTLMEG